MSRKAAIISIEAEEHEKFKKRAATLGLNFSTYIKILCRADCAEGGQWSFGSKAAPDRPQESADE